MRSSCWPLRSSPWPGQLALEERLRVALVTKLSLGIGDASLSEDVRHWVNEGLMAVFFFVVGLEIKRELVAGELRSWRTAALPAFAALGGMVVPAALYTAVNLGEPGARGWGIPMATDIAFAVGVLALLGSRVNPSLRLFLLTLAIVDDIGAIVVIAAFHSDGIRWPPLAAAALVLLAVGLLPRARIYWLPPYAASGADGVGPGVRRRRARHHRRRPGRPPGPGPAHGRGAGGPALVRGPERRAVGFGPRPDGRAGTPRPSR